MHVSDHTVRLHKGSIRTWQPLVGPVFTVQHHAAYPFSSWMRADSHWTRDISLEIIKHDLHVRRVSRQFLDDKGIDVIDWPQHSPDLSLLENLWDVMCRSIWSCQVAPQNVQELTDALIQVREEIPRTPSTISSGECPDIVESAYRHIEAHYWLKLGEKRWCD